MQLLELIQRRSQKPLGDLKSHQLLLLIRDWAHGDDDIGKHWSFQDLEGVLRVLRGGRFKVFL